jgi:hypothetical protein
MEISTPSDMDRYNFFNHMEEFKLEAEKALFDFKANIEL